MIHNRSVPANTLLAHVTCADLPAAVAWLETTLGFVEHYRYGDPIAGVQLHLGDAWIMLNTSGPERATPALVGKMTQSLTIVVPDVGRLHERVMAAGGLIVEALNETIYGERQFVVRDPDGHHWLIAQHIRDVAPDAWGATVRPSSSPSREHQMTNEPSTTQPHVTGIAPWLSVADATRAVAFYRAAFGAEETERLGDDAGNVIVANLRIGDASFWVQADPDASPEAVGGSPVRMIVTVDDPDTLFARAVAAGATVVASVHEEQGWRVGRIADPSGHHWELARPLTP